MAAKTTATSQTEASQKPAGTQQRRAAPRKTQTLADALPSASVRRAGPCPVHPRGTHSWEVTKEYDESRTASGVVTKRDQTCKACHVSEVGRVWSRRYTKAEKAAA